MKCAGLRKHWKEDKIRVEKRENSPAVQKRTLIQLGSFYNRRRTIGRFRINGREFYRCCFVAEYRIYIQLVQDVNQDPVLNTKEVDVAYGKA